MNKIIAITASFTLLPPGVIFRGKSGKDLKVEFDDEVKSIVIKDKLVEAKPDGTAIFRKPGETAKTSAELIKEGKPPKLEKSKNTRGTGK
jgi:hypothetical protein